MKKIIRLILRSIYKCSRYFSFRINDSMLLLRGYILFGKTGVKAYPNINLKESTNITIGKNVTIHSNVRFQQYDNSPIIISNNVEIFDHSVIQSLGGGIIIGENVIIGEYTTIQAQANVTIEDDVLLASKIQFISNTHTYEDINIPIKYQPNISSPILVKRGAWIGINSTILAGVTIGINSIVGGGSLVTKDVPNYTVVGGIPAKPIKKYDTLSRSWTPVKKDII